MWVRTRSAVVLLEGLPCGRDGQTSQTAVPDLLLAAAACAWSLRKLADSGLEIGRQVTWLGALAGTWRPTWIHRRYVERVLQTATVDAAEAEFDGSMFLSDSFKPDSWLRIQQYEI